MAELDLHYVNELIAVRREQHGGGQGAPAIEAGHRIGASINRSCIVMLSALLQTHVEDVFQDAAKRAFPALNANAGAFALYWNQMKNWGNPSDVNIGNLFLRIGVPDVFDGLSWQRTTTADIKRKLGELNQVRNRIAHGNRNLTLNGAPYSLTLAKVEAYRNLAGSFGQRFAAHVAVLVPAP